MPRIGKGQRKLDAAHAFRERIDAARDFFDFQIDRLESSFNLETAPGRTGFANRMADSIRLLSDPLLRQAVIQKVSARLGLPAATSGNGLIMRGGRSQVNGKPEMDPGTIRG